VVLYRRLTASTQSRAPERTLSRSGQPRNSPLLEEGLGRDPEVIAPELYCGLRQHRRSGGAGGSRPAPSGSEFRRKRLRVGQPAALPFEARPTRGRSGSTPVATRRHDDQVCVFDAPGGAPHRIAPTAICLMYPSGDGWLTVATLAWAGARLSRSPRTGGAGLRGGQVHPLLPKQRAHPEVGGPQAGQVRPPGPASRSQ
jgi:hypothetical protein